jgi:hypothetical protein
MNKKKEDFEVLLLSFLVIKPKTLGYREIWLHRERRLVLVIKMHLVYVTMYRITKEMCT